MGHELAKQRTWENVPGRGQQGKGLELISMWPAEMAVFTWLEWGGDGGTRGCERGKMTLEGQGWKGSLGAWQVELGWEGCKEGKEESSYPLHSLPRLVMCWATDEKVKKVLETSNYLVTNNSAW